nr:hypothetical protein [Tanacetum cinerariifolium]
SENVYDDPFDSKGEKIEDFKLLVDELDLPCDFLLPFEYDSFISKDFSKVDALPLTNNKDKDFDPPLYELLSSKKFPVAKRKEGEKSSSLDKVNFKYAQEGFKWVSIVIKPLGFDLGIHVIILIVSSSSMSISFLP